MSIFLTFTAVIAALLVLTIYTRRYTERMLRIGTTAVATYIKHADGEALVAAMAVKAMVSKYHGIKWQETLEIWPFMPTESEEKARHAQILSMLNEQDSNAKQCLAYKERLRERSPQWFSALSKCDEEAAARVEVDWMNKERDQVAN